MAELAVYNKSTGTWVAPSPGEFRSGYNPQQTDVRLSTGRIVNVDSAEAILDKARSQAAAEAASAKALLMKSTEGNTATQVAQRLAAQKAITQQGMREQELISSYAQRSYERITPESQRVTSFNISASIPNKPQFGTFTQEATAKLIKKGIGNGRFALTGEGVKATYEGTNKILEERGKTLEAKPYPSFYPEMIKKSLAYENLQKDIAMEKAAEEKGRVTTTKNPLTGFEKRIEGIKTRESAFFGSKGFQRIRDLANRATQFYPLGMDIKNIKPVAYEDKGFFGKTAELTASGFMSAPIAIGGMFPLIGEKIAATSEAIYHKETRGEVLSELGRAAKETIITTYNPTTPEGASTLVSAGLFALPMATGSILSGKGGFGPSFLKLKYESVKGTFKPKGGELDVLRDQVAREATRQGGYLAGVSAVEIQLPKGSFRTGMDADIYFKDQSKVESFAVRAIDIAKTNYINRGLNPERLQLKQATSHIKVVDTQTGLDVVDVGLRNQPGDVVVDVGGINARYYGQILADKKAIVKFEKVDLPKIAKAKNDLKLAEQARLIMTEKKPIYSGFFLQGTEGVAKPLFGVAGGRELVPIFGKPSIKQLVRLNEEIIYPTLSRKNLATYPQTPAETSILGRSDILTKLGTTASDVRKVELIKLFESKSKDIKKLYGAELPKETKLLNSKEMDYIYSNLKKSPNSYVRVYGSLVDIAQRPNPFKRIAGDIELEFSNKASALTKGTELAKGIKGGEVKEVEGKGLGVWKDGDKAIELKYPGDASELELSKGFRYGYLEYRKPVNLLGLTSQTFGEQIIRKAGASGTYWQIPNKLTGKRQLVIESALHRPKDVVDTYAEILSAVEKGKLPKEYIKYAEEWRNQEWRNPEVQTLFKEFDANRNAYLNNIRIELTPALNKESIYSSPMGTLVSSVGKINYPSRSINPSIIKSPLSSVSTSISPSVSKSSVSVSSSNFISPSVSSSISPSKLVSPSPSPSPSRSVSPSKSPSPSPSISRYISPSPSPSPSRSVSPSRSPSPSPSPFKSPSRYNSPYIKPSASVSISNKNKYSYFKSAKAFAAFIKRKGKYIRVSPALTKEEALGFGALFARKTLAATFKVQQVEGSPQNRPELIGKFNQLKNIFRAYQIRKGQRVPLVDTYIQRRGTRLGSIEERKAIQIARKQVVNKMRSNFLQRRSLNLIKNFGGKSKWF